MREVMSLGVAQPTPEEVKAARERAGLTQTQAVLLITVASKAAYKRWLHYEAAPDSENFRAIPLAAWELFLLKTGQHPIYRLIERGGLGF